MVMARQVAREFGSFNITANSVAPSFADTDMLTDLKLEGKQEDSCEVKRNPAPCRSARYGKCSIVSSGGTLLPS